MDARRVETRTKMTKRDDKTLRMPGSSLGWITATVSSATQAWTLTGGLLASIGYKFDTGNLQIIPLPWKAMPAHPLRFLVYGAANNVAVLTPTPQLMGYGNSGSTRKSVSRKSISGSTLNPTGTYFRITSSTSTTQVTDRYYCWAVIRPSLTSVPVNPTISWFVLANLQTAIVRF